MIPTNGFEKFKYDILTNYPDYDEITFGILIVDPRQTDSREYILNYLDVFHNKSDILFDFFIPGYIPHNIDKFYETPSFRCIDSNNYVINVKNTEFTFDKNVFNNFCKELNKNWGIQYTFNPMLILMSMKSGQLGTAKYIIIELDTNDYHTARRSGYFFMELFDSISSDNNIKHMQNHIRKTCIKGNLLDSIINSIGKSWLTEVYHTAENIKRYCIKN